MMHPSWNTSSKRSQMGRSAFFILILLNHESHELPQLVAKLLGSAPLPAVNMLRPLPPLPLGSVLLILAAPHPPMNCPSSVLGKASQLRAHNAVTSSSVSVTHSTI